MVLKNIPMSNDITVKKSLALAGIIILIYSLISLDRWGFELNIFTEESYVMLLVGLILVYPLCKEILVDKDSEKNSTVIDLLSQLRLPDIIIFGSLFSLSVYVFFIK